MIQAAGHHRAVHQHGDLLAQAQAEMGIPLRGGQIRPVEALRLLQIDLLPQFPVAGTGLGASERIDTDLLRQKAQDLAVARVRAADVPKPKGADDAPLPAGAGKLPAAGEVVRQLPGAVTLHGVEGDADLMEGRGGKKRIRALPYQRPVGGDADLKAHVPGDG